LLVLGQERRQILLSRLEQDGQVAAVHHVYAAVAAQGTRLAHQPAEVRVQLRRATGQVERPDVLGRQHVEHRVHGGLVHLLGAAGPGVYMAVHAGLVAGVAQIDLQGLDGAAAQRREVGDPEQRQGGVQGGSPEALIRGTDPKR